MNDLSQPKNADTSVCPTCGSKIKNQGNSLHVWDITYECGCNIWGPIFGEDIIVHIECPYLIKTNTK